MPAYFIVHLDVRDPAEFEEYRKQALRLRTAPSKLVLVEGA